MREAIGLERRNKRKKEEVTPYRHSCKRYLSLVHDSRWRHGTAQRQEFFSFISARGGVVYT